MTVGASIASGQGAASAMMLCRSGRQELWLPRLQGKLRRSRERRYSVARIGGVGFGWRLCRSGEGRVGLGAVVRAQEGEREKLALEKAEGKRNESWSSSLKRASVVSRIFMAAFVWISLFFGVSVANNEMGGGRPGRQGPFK